MAQEHSILLDAGTNEVEIIELLVTGQSFGINVAKIREIIQFDEDAVHQPPHAHPSVTGVLRYRDGVHMLIDLGQHLYENPCDKQVVVVTELNGIVAAFLVDGVNRIYRRTWESISPLSPLLASPEIPISGSIQVEGREILLLDLESVLGEIMPASRLDPTAVAQSDPDRRRIRGMKKLIFAEDSRFLRALMVKALDTAGYALAEISNDGEDAWEALASWKATVEAEGRPLSDFCDVVVTDIEMPRLDGLTLCKKIKSDPVLKDLPVLVFSSLINAQMAKKCVSVGADAYVSKPEVTELIDSIDALCLDV